MIAAIDKKIAAGVGKLAFFDVLDPGSINPNGDIVLCLAGDRASVAPDTFALVYHEGVFCHELFHLFC